MAHGSPDPERHQHQGLEISAEPTSEALREFIEVARGMGGPSRMDMSPLS